MVIILLATNQKTDMPVSRHTTMVQNMLMTKESDIRRWNWISDLLANDAQSGIDEAVN
jgi:hypothetical protein